MKDTAHNSPMMAFKRRYGDMKRVESPRDENLSVNRCRANIDSSYGKSFADLGEMLKAPDGRQHFARVNWFNAEKGFGTVVAPKLSVSPGNRPESGERPGPGAGFPRFR